MKLKDVNLNKPHYIISISVGNNHIFVTKAKHSTIQKFKYETKHLVYESVGFYIYPELETSHSYIDSPILSLEANPEEEIYVGGHYIRFNLNHKCEFNYIAFDLATMKQLIYDYFKKRYNIVRQTEGIVYRKGYSKDIQGMYKQYLKQIKKYLM